MADINVGSKVRFVKWDELSVVSSLPRIGDIATVLITFDESWMYPYEVAFGDVDNRVYRMMSNSEIELVKEHTK